MLLSLSLPSPQNLTRRFRVEYDGKGSNSRALVSNWISDKTDIMQPFTDPKAILLTDCTSTAR